MIAVGQLIGNYRVERQLGEGGMGAVFVAVHQDIGRRAAIKVLHPHLAQNPELGHRFLNEARAANIIEHPGIVEIYEYARLPDNTTYIVMEFLKGDTLTKRMARGLTQAETLRLSRQIASVLVAAHAKGIIHRDLKPDNVIIVADPEAPGGERAKLLDFGIAKVADAYQKAGEVVKTQASMLLGTPVYMSPEQCRGAGEVTDKADVYSLGIMLYQMLCGAPPFDAVGLGDLLIMHTTQAPPPLRERNPAISERLALLVHRMLAKPAAERPTMAEVVAELEHLGASTTGVLHLSSHSPQRSSTSQPVMTTPPPSKPLGGTVVLPENQAGSDAALPPTIHNTPLQLAPHQATIGVTQPPAPQTQTPMHSTGIVSRGGEAALASDNRGAGAALAIGPGAPPPSSKAPILIGVGAALLLAAGGAGYVALKKLRPTSGPVTQAPDLGGPRTPRRPPPPEETTADAPKAPAGMVYVPGGAFVMGSTARQIDEAFAWCQRLTSGCRRDLYEREQPQRKVRLAGFFLDQHEVTSDELAAWLSDIKGLKVKRQQVLDGKAPLAGLAPEFDGALVRKGKGFAAREGAGKRPAVQVTWLAADRYCRDHGKRLPSEAQWEYAARGARDGARFPWGDEEPRCEGAVFARVSDGACKGQRPGAAEVGESRQDRSPQGARDLAGNVSEWVADRFVAPYPACAAPCADPRADAGGDPRVIRGGNWSLPAESLRAAGRSRAEEDKLLTNVGFRCAKAADDAAPAEGETP